MLEPNRLIQDRYQLQQRLGKNAGRQTWQAADTHHQNQPVTVKFLAFGGDVHWEQLKLFEREAQVLRQLDHPCIPQYLDFFAIDDRSLWFGLVHQYVPGSSLKEISDRGVKLSDPQIQRIATEVLQILVYLHSLSPPVLHRDIKPSNLILAESDRLHLIDFGAVQDKAAAEGATFTVVGTYGYTPLEQFGGRAVPASDLYALGATLIHLATGTSPADLPTQQLKIQFQNNLGLDEGFARWLEKLVEPDLGERFASATEALEVLRDRRALLALKPLKFRRKSQLTSAKTQLIERPKATKVVLEKSPESLHIDLSLAKLRRQRKSKNLSFLSSIACLTLSFFIIPLLFLTLLFWMLVVLHPLGFHLILLLILLPISLTIRFFDCLFFEYSEKIKTLDFSLEKFSFLGEFTFVDRNGEPIDSPRKPPFMGRLSQIQEMTYQRSKKNNQIQAIKRMFEKGVKKEKLEI